MLLLGDSFTEGFTVDLDRHFAPDLERRLNASAGKPVEILNSGVSAWGNAQELIYFLLEGVRYSPDLVVLLFNPGNDVGENVPGLGRPEPELAAKPWFALEGGQLKVHDFPARGRARMPGSDASPLQDFLERHTHVYPIVRYLAGKVADTAGWTSDRSGRGGKKRKAGPAAGGARPRAVRQDAREPSAHVAFALENLTPRWASAWQLTKEIVRDMRRRVEASGARFAVAIVPNKFAVRGAVQTWFDGRQKVAIDLSRPETRSEEFFVGEGIATCALLPAFVANFAATGRTGFHEWDVHWNAEGNAIVAGELASCLQRLDLVPGRGR